MYKIIRSDKRNGTTKVVEFNTSRDRDGNTILFMTVSVYGKGKFKISFKLEDNEIAGMSLYLDEVYRTIVRGRNKRNEGKK